MDQKKQKVLIVDDDPNLSEIIMNILEYAGYKTESTQDGKSCIQKIQENSYDCLLLDLKLPDISGLEVLKKITGIDPFIQTIMISGQGTIDTAIEATRLGAFDFLEKPLDSERILVTLKNAQEKGNLKKEKFRLLEGVKKNIQMVGESPAIKKIQKLIIKAAATNSKVLISGENGTGKELVAKSIHYHSSRASGPFVPVNCAAIPDTLIESELFGYTKGAFTGAITDKMGRFQAADSGTLFLDEIGDMSLMTQAKVLRALEEGVVERVGSRDAESVDVHVLAATNKDLVIEIEAGKFRKDLFFRLNVLDIRIPPLRERNEDIILLANHFLKRFCEDHHQPMKNLASKTIRFLTNYSWPGNVRELKNLMEKLVILIERDEILVQDVSSVLAHPPKTKRVYKSNLSFKEARKEFERSYIRDRLLEYNWHVTKAADAMNISRTYLHKKIAELRIEM
jgi:two-component system nitrogen regulation response regulator NtrX